MIPPTVSTASRFRIPPALRALLCAGLVGSASAAEVTYSTTITPNSAPVINPEVVEFINLPLFDPSLGSLQAVELTLDGQLEATIAIENLDPVEAGTATSWVNGQIWVYRGFDLMASVAPEALFVNFLEPFDGDVDFGGDSGAVNPPEIVPASSTGTRVFGVDDLTPFLGSGPGFYAVLTFGTYGQTGLSFTTLGANIFLSGTVTLKYTYEPSGPTGGSIGDRVWLDSDGDGIDDGGLEEPGLAGAIVELRTPLGDLVDVTLSGPNGEYTFSEVDAGTYVVVASPPPGDDWTATYDADGLITPGSVVVVLGENENREDIDFGWVPVDSVLTQEEQPPFWATTEGLDQVFLAHVSLLNDLPLVDRYGNPVDFSTTDITVAQAALATFLKKSSTSNAAYRLSSELAAFALNVSHGLYAPDALFDLGNGTALSAEGVLDQVTALLLLDSYTPGGDPNRAIQNQWICRLRFFNGGAPCL